MPGLLFKFTNIADKTTMMANFVKFLDTTYGGLLKINVSLLGAYQPHTLGRDINGFTAGGKGKQVLSKAAVQQQYMSSKHQVSLAIINDKVCFK
jgi:hypothetical protein